jgi:hypothetical protein
MVFLGVFYFPPSARFLRLMIGGVRDTCVRLTSWLLNRVNISGLPICVSASCRPRPQLADVFPFQRVLPTVWKDPFGVRLEVVTSGSRAAIDALPALSRAIREQMSNMC